MLIGGGACGGGGMGAGTGAQHDCEQAGAHEAGQDAPQNWGSWGIGGGGGGGAGGKLTIIGFV